MPSKSLKLKTHARTACAEDMIISLEAFSKHERLVDGDVVEIAAADDQSMKLLLKVKELSQELQQKGGPLSIAADVAQTFGLVAMKTVSVRTVNKEGSKIDLLELKFKDCSLSGSDMWRFTNTLMESCVYVTEKLSFCDVRAQVLALWSKGVAVNAGLVLPGTRVLFRSSSTHMFVCIQISEEMWQFDSSGNLYFDKAVLGFLKQLFDHWKEEGCNHHVTLIFFSRTYYKARSESEFPHHMQAALCRDHRDVLYSDFYEVLLDGPHWRDWAHVVNEVKISFKTYKQKTHCDPDSPGVEGTMSQATCGNFLECLNLTVNVFSKKHLNPAFHLTGQQMIIVTAGVGVFEVQRELTRITSERIMDYGLGVDVVSLTEQPLHAVPLFSLQSCDHHMHRDYAIPQWINYNFYDPQSEWTGGWFQPRIRLPDYMINGYLKDCRHKKQQKDVLIPTAQQSSRSGTPMMFLKRECDFDEYDSQVFSKRTSHGGLVKQIPRSSSIHTDSPVLRRYRSNEYLYGTSFMPSPQFDRRKPGQPDAEDRGLLHLRRAPGRAARRHVSSESGDSLNQSDPIMTEAEQLLSSRHSPSLGPYIDSREQATSSDFSDFALKGPLINPFKPKSLPQEVSANKRKWIHAFPFTSKGHAFQSHHAMGLDSSEALLFSVQEEEGGERDRAGSSGKDSSSLLPSPFAGNRKRSESDSDVLGLSLNHSEIPLDTQSLDRVEIDDPSTAAEKTEGSSGGKLLPSQTTTSNRLRRKSLKKQANQTKRPLFEPKITDSKGVKPEVVDNFAPVRRTGIDWKALTDPACLPVTTDYLPSETTLVGDYSTNLYSLSATHSQSESGASHVQLNCLSGFRELISQRLSQGFQLVLSDSGSLATINQKLKRIAADMRSKRLPPREGSVMVKMSLGRVYHYLTLTFPTISVAVHKAKHTPKFGMVRYSYFLRPPSHPGFLGSNCLFQHEKPEEYNWNFLDQHVMGYEDFDILSEGIKYHRNRFLLLPKESKGSRPDAEDAIVAGFVRFLEFINFLRRPSTRRSSHDSLVSLPYSSRDSSVFSYEKRLTSKSRQASMASLAEDPHHHNPSYSRFSSAEFGVRPASTTANMEPQGGGGKSPQTRTPSPSFTKASAHFPGGGSAESTRSSGSTLSGTKEGKLSATSAYHRSTSADVHGSSAHLGDSWGKSTAGLSSLASTSHLSRQHSDVHVASDTLVAKRDSITPTHERSQQPPPLSPNTSRPTSRSGTVSSSASFYLEGSIQLRENTTSDATSPASTLEEDDSNATVTSDVMIKTTPPTPKTTAPPDLQLQDPGPEEERKDDETTSHNSSSLLPANDFAAIVKAVKDDKTGIDFIVTTKGSALRSHSFIAKELVDWLKENVEGISTTAEGLRLCRKLQKKGLLIHSSGSHRVPFLYGFYLFSLTNIEVSEEAESTSPKLNTSFVIINGELESFRKHRFEVGIVMARPDELSGGAGGEDVSSYQSTPCSRSPSLPASSHPVPRVQDELLERTKVAFCDAEWTTSHVAQISPDFAMASDRMEWCTVTYDAVFLPDVAYQIEFQWVVATATLLAKQITQWCRRAEMCGFHLVSVPSWQSLEQNPFHKPHTIPLPLDMEKLNECGLSGDPKTVYKIIHRILQKFGFVLDPISIQDDIDVLCHDAAHKKFRGSLEEWVLSGDVGWQCCPVYVHHTGTCLVRPVVAKIRESSSNNRHQYFSSRLSSSTTSGFVYRTDSEATLNAGSSLDTADDVFQGCRGRSGSGGGGGGQWGPPHKHTRHPVPMCHSTPHTSPEQGSSSGQLYVYKFKWFSNTAGGSTQQGIVGLQRGGGGGGSGRSAAATADLQSELLQEFVQFCEDVHEHLDELSPHSTFLEANHAAGSSVTKSS